MKILRETVSQLFPCSEDSLSVLEHPVRVLAEQELCVIETPVTFDSSPLGSGRLPPHTGPSPEGCRQTFEMD